jgi:hypothetical protein
MTEVYHTFYPFKDEGGIWVGGEGLFSLRIVGKHFHDIWHRTVVASSNIQAKIGSSFRRSVHTTLSYEPRLLHTEVDSSVWERNPQR